MLETLPLELVAEVLRVTAEVCLLTDRQTIRNIALSCSLGYSSAIPVLYSSFIFNEKNEDCASRVFDEDTSLANSVLRTAPSERLCPHIRRSFFETNFAITSAQLRLLVNLRSIFNLDLEFAILSAELLHHSVPTFKQLYVLSVDYPAHIPPYVTHVSYYIHLPHATTLTSFEDYAKRVLPDAVTHVAIELNAFIDSSYVTELLSLLKTLLGRISSAPVVLRLYRDDGCQACETVVLKAIARLESEQLRRRVQLWRDTRPMEADEDDINASKIDCIVGRTPWEEAESVSQVELEAAENWQGPPTLVEEDESES